MEGLDTLKLYTKAMGTKTQNLIINLEDDPEKWFTDDEKTLAEYGCGEFLGYSGGAGCYGGYGILILCRT